MMEEWRQFLKTEINVSRVIERCYTGSPEANVDNIKLEYESYMEKFNNFTVSY